MQGETNLQSLLSSMSPELHAGDYVFCTVTDTSYIDQQKIISYFRETEGLTIIIAKDFADELQLAYSFVAAWITLKVHSSLEAVGLTAAFSAALAGQNISCNVIAGFYHDHIFVNKSNAGKAIVVLTNLSKAGGKDDHTVV
jgi:hypothetical protein